MRTWRVAIITASRKAEDGSYEDYQITHYSLLAITEGGSSRRPSNVSGNLFFFGRRMCVLVIERGNLTNLC